jgi:hypothetical protein
LLAALLRAPGREVHALDLAGAGAQGDSGSVLDELAKANYRNRLRELDDDITEASAWSDPERAARAEIEKEFLVRELAGAVGLGGRDRKSSSDAERARVNVTRALRATIDRIRDHSPPLAEHLDATVRTGTYCSYTPDPRSPARWDAGRDDKGLASTGGRASPT